MNTLVGSTLCYVAACVAGVYAHNMTTERPAYKLQSVEYVARRARRKKSTPNWESDLLFELLLLYGSLDDTVYLGSKHYYISHAYIKFVQVGRKTCVSRKSVLDKYVVAR